ncbi:MAG TPA: DUF3471 domain-containing protein [Pyrinomonadaceae bacterium]|nr:DUF3471 domain-containing protein [Pyrinomonadaceae bacterium]
MSIETVGACSLIEGYLEYDVVHKRLSEVTSADGKKEFSARYVLLKGLDIESIDQNGVRASGYATFIITAVQNQPPDDATVLEQAKGLRDAPGLVMSERGVIMTVDLNRFSTLTPEQRGLVTDVITPDGRIYLPLVGQFRPDAEKGQRRLFTTLAVHTESGPIDIPIGEIAAFKTAEKVAARPPDSLDPKVMEAYVGTYEDPDKRAAINVVIKDNKLMVEFAGHTAELIPQAADEFKSEGSTIRFLREEGRVTRLVFSFAGRQLQLNKK